MGYRTDWAAPAHGHKPTPGNALFLVNGRQRQPGAPFADPCAPGAPERLYRAAFIQTELTYNTHGWFDPQGRMVILEHDIKDIIDPNNRTRLPEPLFFRANSGECIRFTSTNFMPGGLNADDFQMYTPTDTVGQHIHLVKFDVTSSDGSGNGWNYEDATFSPDEVRERIFAYNRWLVKHGRHAGQLRPRAHPLFQPGGDIYQAADGRIDHPIHGRLLKSGICPPQDRLSDSDYEKLLNEDHKLCGAQRTTQRWWADPTLLTTRDAKTGEVRERRDGTLRTVFTHDHMGPSSHQQHGLYAALVIEPANSLWFTLDGTMCNEGLNWVADENAPLRPYLLGGSDVSRPAHPAVSAGAGHAGSVLARRHVSTGRDSRVEEIQRHHVLALLAPREPLRLRADGGPTAAFANIIEPALDGSPPSRTLGQGCRHIRESRREFGLAFADFGIAYNTALEPINPERFNDAGHRDNTALRFGQRHVINNIARPLAISSEDPGSQYINYRHEPLALRISEATPNAAMGGFDYRLNRWRAGSPANCREGDAGCEVCKPGDLDCRGDMANAFSTFVHAQAARDLALRGREAFASPKMRSVFPPQSEIREGQLGAEDLKIVLRNVENWRQRFNCALYPRRDDAGVLVRPDAAPIQGGYDCHPSIVRREPWRVFGDPATPILPGYEHDRVQIRLIQGSQEAQHIFQLFGMKWHRMSGPAGRAPLSGQRAFGVTNAQPIGISEHFEFDIRLNLLDSEATQADYLFAASSMDQFWDGMWGIVRSYGQDRLLRVPPRESISLGNAPTAGPSVAARPAAPIPSARQADPPGEQRLEVELRRRGRPGDRSLSRNGQEPGLRPMTVAPAVAVIPSTGATGVSLGAPPPLGSDPDKFVLERALRALPTTKLADAAEIDERRRPPENVDRPNPIITRQEPPSIHPGLLVCTNAAPRNGHSLGPMPYKSFDISAVRACDLFNDCDQRQSHGIAYSTRFGISVTRRRWCMC